MCPPYFLSKVIAGKRKCHCGVSVIPEVIVTTFAAAALTCTSQAPTDLTTF